MIINLKYVSGNLALLALCLGDAAAQISPAPQPSAFEQMLVYASRGTALVPGDVIGSGTCGSGCLGELWGRSDPRNPSPLGPGDVVRMSVEHIGTIENTVVAGPEPVDYGSSRKLPA